MGQIKLMILGCQKEWLANRKKGLGGSDIAAVLGLNPWMSNTELWEYKTGRKEPRDLSGNELVQYGHDAEPLLRDLFALDHPEYTVGYVENNSFTNTDYPWAVASLDGWLTDREGRRGILEIKTTQKKWEKDKIPDNYFCQVLFYMAVYEADFAIVKCQYKWDIDGEVFAYTSHYKIERKDVQQDIEYLMRKGSEFWELVKRDERPALTLNI